MRHQVCSLIWLIMAYAHLLLVVARHCVAREAGRRSSAIAFSSEAFLCVTCYIVARVGINSKAIGAHGDETIKYIS